MSERQPYSRVYWTIRSDGRLASIYPNDAHLSTWLRLLLAADMAWPAPADVPASVKRSSLTALVEAGVVELLPGGSLFRFHGLDTERGRRRDAAQASAGYRSVTGRLPNGDRTVPERSASRAETRQDETSRDNASEPFDVDDPAVVYQTLFGRRPSAKVLAWIDDLAKLHGPSETGRAIAQAVKDGIGADRVVGVAESYLASRKRDAIRKAKPPKVEPWREELRASIEAGYGAPAAEATA